MTRGENRTRGVVRACLSASRACESTNVFRPTPRRHSNVEHTRVTRRVSRHTRVTRHTPHHTTHVTRRSAPALAPSALGHTSHLLWRRPVGPHSADAFTSAQRETPRQDARVYISRAAVLCGRLCVWRTRGALCGASTCIQETTGSLDGLAASCAPAQPKSEEGLPETDR